MYAYYETKYVAIFETLCEVLDGLGDKPRLVRVLTAVLTDQTARRACYLDKSPADDPRSP